MTKQELLNQVWDRINLQGGPATSEHGGCFYDKLDGKRCAVGVLLSQKTIDRIKDGGLNAQPVDTLFTSSWMDGNEELAALQEHEEFLIDLQAAHDAAGGYHPRGGQGFWDEFWDRLGKVAGKWSLEMPASGRGGPV